MKSREHFLKIFQDLKQKGQLVSPRGLDVLEIENYLYELPPRVRFCNFKERKLNQDYIKREFLWYLRGDRFDISIADHAGIWKSCINKDGSINSNYGQYIFGEMWQNLIETLIKDKDSRRASIAILSNEHLQMETNDVPCTYSLNFRIRNNKLNMTVQMRSQDAFYGMGNDAPAFSLIHEMLYVTLRDLKYDMLELGTYTHFANSFHIYERHFEAFNRLLENPEFEEIEIPEIQNIEEVNDLISGKENNYPFSKWLREVK